MFRLINFLRSHVTYYHPRISYGHTRTNSTHNKITCGVAMVVLSIICFQPFKYDKSADLLLEPDYNAFPYTMGKPPRE